MDSERKQIIDRGSGLGTKKPGDPSLGSIRSLPRSHCSTVWGSRSVSDSSLEVKSAISPPIALGTRLERLTTEDTPSHSSLLIDRSVKVANIQDISGCFVPLNRRAAAKVHHIAMVLLFGG